MFINSSVYQLNLEFSIEKYFVFVCWNTCTFAAMNECSNVFWLPFSLQVFSMTKFKCI